MHNSVAVKILATVPFVGDVALVTLFFCRSIVPLLIKIASVRVDLMLLGIIGRRKG